MGRYVQRYGNQMVIVIDADKYIAYPSTPGVWVVSTSEAPPPNPEPGDGEFRWPFNPNTTVTSEYGPRTGGAGTFHEGIDFGTGGVTYGSDIHVMGNGQITAAASGGGYGPYIDVFLGTKDGHDLYARYGHLDNSNRWAKGENVSKGNLLAEVSDGGFSFGANLHMETHICAIGQYPVNNLNDVPNSGRTAVDPREFFDTYGDGEWYDG